MIDIEALLKPISEQSEAGVDLRPMDLYFEIEEARREDKPEVRGGGKNLKTANWDGEKGVKRLAIDILMTQSKDLKVAVWLTEALFRTEGFQGLQQGLTLLLELQRRYWKTLFPPIDPDGDLRVRQAPLMWLGGKQPQKDNRNIDGARFDSFPLTVRQSPVGDSGNDTALFQDIGGCRQALQKLAAITDEQFGSAVISFADLEKALKERQEVVGVRLNARGVDPRAITAGGPQQAPTDAVEYKAGDAADPVGIGMGPMDRAEALRRLREVAEFFRRTEPHSPVGPLVERAVRWGGMSLVEWLQEMIKDDTVRARVCQELGVNGAQQPDRKTKT